MFLDLSNKQYDRWLLNAAQNYCRKLQAFSSISSILSHVSSFRIMYRELKDAETKADLMMKESGGSGTTAGIQILTEWETGRGGDPTACTVDHVLQLLQRIYALAMDQSPPNNKFGMYLLQELPIRLCSVCIGALIRATDKVHEIKLINSTSTCV